MRRQPHRIGHERKSVHPAIADPGRRRIRAAANFNYNTNYNWVIATASGGLANFSAAGFAVNDALFQNDLAGGYFYVSTNGNSLLLTFTNNTPPVASPVSNYLSASVMTIPIATLAPHWNDPNGDPVILFLVNASSGIGTNNVAGDGVNIYYTNVTGAADVITYLVQDVRTNPPAVYRAEDTVQTGVGDIYILPPPAIGRVGWNGNNLTLSGSGGQIKRFWWLLAHSAPPLDVEWLPWANLSSAWREITTRRPMCLVGIFPAVISFSSVRIEISSTSAEAAFENSILFEFKSSSIDKNAQNLMRLGADEERLTCPACAVDLILGVGFVARMLRGISGCW